MIVYYSTHNVEILVPNDLDEALAHEESIRLWCKEYINNASKEYDNGNLLDWEFCRIKDWNFVDLDSEGIQDYHRRLYRFWDKSMAVLFSLKWVK